MLRLRFKNGKVLIQNGKIQQNCCRWKVTGYRTVILPEGCTYGAQGCPACRSTVILTISSLYFNGEPETAVAAGVTGYIGVDCDNNPDYLPCRNVDVPFADAVYIKTICSNGRTAEVWYEVEDCPGARDSENTDPLRNKDLRIIFTLESQ